MFPFGNQLKLLTHKYATINTDRAAFSNVVISQTSYMSFTITWTYLILTGGQTFMYLCKCAPKHFKQDELHGQQTQKKRGGGSTTNTALIIHTLHSDDMNTFLLRCAGRIRKRHDMIVLYSSCVR